MGASQSSTVGDNGTEAPSKEDMIPCGTEEITGSDAVKANDGLRGQLNLQKKKVSATNTKPKEDILVRVKNLENDREIAFKTMLHSSGRSITLDSNKRSKLGLTKGDKVKFWIAGVEDDEKDVTRNKSLLDTEESDDDDDEYLLLESDPRTYHIKGDEDGKTVCNTEYDLEKDEDFSNPGDVPLQLCDECSIRSSKNLSNEKLVRWLGERAGFEPRDNNPAYLTNAQLTKLRDYILEMES
jgi:hypothetical protein